MDLNFKVENQKLIKIEHKYLVSQSDNYIRLKFDFRTVDWNNMDIFVLLKNEDNETFQFSYDKEKGIVVPYPVVKNKHFYVSVYGVNDNYRITTNELKVKLFTSGYTQDLSSLDEEYSKDILHELNERLRHKINKSEISNVGLSGEYSDLKNVPLEFNPSFHEHEDYATHLEVDEKIIIHDNDFESHNDIRESIPVNVSDLVNDVGFINEHQSLDDYYTKSESDNKYLQEHQSLSGYYTKREVDTYLDSKVNTITGKGLSTEDYTTNEKNKLANLSNYDDTEIISRLDEFENLLLENANKKNVRIITLKVPQGRFESEGSISKSYRGLIAYLSIKYGDEYHCINHYSETIDNIDYYVFEFLNIPNGEGYTLSVNIIDNGVINFVEFDVIENQDVYIIEPSSEDIQSNSWTAYVTYIDTDGNPISNLECKVTDKNYSESTVYTNSNGTIQVKVNTGFPSIHTEEEKYSQSDVYFYLDTDENNPIPQYAINSDDPIDIDTSVDYIDIVVTLSKGIPKVVPTVLKYKKLTVASMNTLINTYPNPNDNIPLSFIESLETDIITRTKLPLTSSFAVFNIDSTTGNITPDGQFSWNQITLNNDDSTTGMIAFGYYDNELTNRGNDIVIGKSDVLKVWGDTIIVLEYPINP